MNLFDVYPSQLIAGAGSAKKPQTTMPTTTTNEKVNFERKLAMSEDI